jgi:hypothetical protein
MPAGPRVATTMKDSNIRPIQRAIPAKRQADKRHYGVHPYFTRRPSNVVRKYIQHYSKEGDLVLDPFGGSGVTAIEAWLENRTGIHNDINPFANFIAEGIFSLAEGSHRDYQDALALLEGRCKERLVELGGISDEVIPSRFSDVVLPANLCLPRTADVRHFHELFSTKQLYALATLLQGIRESVPLALQKGFLLAWSATAAKLNLTFLSAQGRAASRGGSSIFSIYRYKVAKEPVELPAWKTFAERFVNVLAAKKEIGKVIEANRRTRGWKGRFVLHALDYEALAETYDSQIDYIFTDPPYGAHIAYLDLSILWNGWLDMVPDADVRQQELIVGGEFGLSEASYVEGLGKSVKSCVRMLKPGRWLSIVFQHWNVAYFETILSAAASAGADLKAAVSQVGDPIWSMHKKKGSDSVLAGEMILTFCRTGAVQATIPSSFEVGDHLHRILRDSPVEHVFGEYVFNQMILDAWRCGAIEKLNVSRIEFSELMRESGWEYDSREHYWVRSGRRAGLLMGA